MEFRVNGKENVYFGIKVAATFGVLIWIAFALKNLASLGIEAIASSITIIVFYALFIWFFLFLQKLFLIGHLKGNGIEISESQFADVHRKYLAMAERMGIKRVPKLFILQEGGFLNAFAVRFSGKHYIAIYSEVFSLFETNEGVVNFVLAHELAHVRRNHLVKRFWTLPSAIIPFLEAAYSRSCEYTCDNFGKALVPGSCVEGLVLLAAGKDIFSRINVAAYLKDAKENNTAVVKFAGLFMSHPYLPRRIANLEK